MGRERNKTIKALEDGVDKVAAAMKAREGEAEAFTRPDRERDRGTAKAVSDKVSTMKYAGQEWPTNPAVHGEKVTDADKTAYKKAAVRLSQDGDVSYAGTRPDTNKVDPYDKKKFFLKDRK